MTYLAPLPRQVSFTGSRACTWLLGLYELMHADTSIPITSLLQTLVGCWICEKALMERVRQSGAQSLALEVQKRLEIAEEALPTLLSSDAALVLLSAGILRKLNVRNAVIELLIEQIASTIQIDRDQPDITEIFTTHFLLRNLNTHIAPCSYTFTSPWNVHGINPFQPNELVIRSLTADIAAVTAYGQKTLSAEPEFLRELVIVLPIWMLYYLHQHNLEVGTLLLRTMSYLHLREDMAFQMGLNFILAQQQLDGRFGFLAPEISRLRSIKPGFDDLFELYLPLTVSCLWAIAEATDPGFILFSSI
jgi:hypothetical protein